MQQRGMLIDNKPKNWYIEPNLFIDSFGKPSIKHNAPSCICDQRKWARH
jgi:hypothetical protein